MIVRNIFYFFIFQHKEAIEFVIEKNEVFKKEKKMRDRERIRHYGDEKEMLEGDFNKPETPASPFYRSEFTIIKIQNKTGKGIVIKYFGKSVKKKLLELQQT